MTNITLQTPVYVTIDDVRDTSKKTSLIAESDDTISELIYRSQIVIDRYIGAYGTPFVSTQDWIFPVDVDWVSTIPDELKLATIWVVEKLYVNGDTITGWTAGWAVVEERLWESKIKYSEGTVTTSEEIPDIAKKILRKYRRTFYTSKF